VLDEPTAALDPESVEDFREVLLPALAGRTVLLVTHDLELAALLPRVVALDRGRIVFDGPAQELAWAPGSFTSRPATRPWPAVVPTSELAEVGS
jgi:ABC-type multidrug transport system ATPase subunit